MFCRPWQHRWCSWWLQLKLLSPPLPASIKIISFWLISVLYHWIIDNVNLTSIKDKVAILLVRFPIPLVFGAGEAKNVTRFLPAGCFLLLCFTCWNYFHTCWMKRNIIFLLEASSCLIKFTKRVRALSVLLGTIFSCVLLDTVQFILKIFVVLNHSHP